MRGSLPAEAISRDDDPWGAPSAALMAQEELEESEPDELEELEESDEVDVDDDEDPPSPEDFDSRLEACLASCLSAPEEAERSISRLRLAVP
jgi:hypothetical protein